MPRRDDRRVPCPFCGHPLLFVRRTRSERNGVGFVRLRMYRCFSCEKRFLSLEMPIEVGGEVKEFPKTNLAAEDVWANLAVFKRPEGHPAEILPATPAEGGGNGAASHEEPQPIAEPGADKGVPVVIELVKVILR